MHGVRLSRWNMSYFSTAVVSVLLAEMLWSSDLVNPLQNIGAPWVLVGVHLTTIGFVTLMMMGALHQFVPVLTKTELASQGWSGVTFFSITIGLVGMILGFLLRPGPFSWLLPLGGSGVVIGAVIAAVNLGITLKRAWPWTLPAWFVATGLVFLLLTAFAGFTLALGLIRPQWFSAGTLGVMGGRGLAAHVIGGVGGWLTLTAMGVSYKLLAMFTLSDEHRGVWGWMAYVLAAFGILIAWGAEWIGARSVAAVGWLLMLLGLASYLWDMGRLYRQRKRRHLELNARYGLVALVMLAVIVLVSLGIVGQHRFSRIDIVLVFLALYGWLGGLALTQLYKIIPFLTWINRFGHRMGKGSIPRVQDLVNENRDRYGFLLYFASITLASLFLWLGRIAAFHAMMGAAVVATLDIARALYHGAHPEIDGGAAEAPVPNMGRKQVR